MRILIAFFFVLITFSGAVDERTKLCRRDESRDSCKLKMFVNQSITRAEHAMHVMKEARSAGSLDVTEDADLVFCEEMLDVAKDRLVKSLDQLRQQYSNVQSYANVHAWLSGALTRYHTCIDGIDSDVAKLGIEPELRDLITMSRMALDVLVSISHVESKRVVKYGVPFWQPKLVDSNPEELKSKADVIVAKDGTGHYKTIMGAVAAAPDNSNRRYVIYVKTGIYDEIVNVGKKKTNLTIVGDGKDLTIITSSLSDKAGTKTYYSAALAVDGMCFMAQDLCIMNTAGPTMGQAVALRVAADMSVIYRCRIDGFQDTLYAHSERQFYRDCFITGTIDFICGHAAAVFQNCQIESRKLLQEHATVITAQARQHENQSSGFTMQNCSITASFDLVQTKGVQSFLGRPWREMSTVAIMETNIGGFLDPRGWTPWNSSMIGLTTLYYGEYKNTGAGANTSGRIKWKGFHVITNIEEAEKFTVSKFLHGNLWINSMGVPYSIGL